MSKPVNPMAIGGFMLGGVMLLILALLVFGRGQIFKPRIHWVVYFDTSLNGLNVGAPVKVQGVQVGIVKEIELQLDTSQQHLVKPVVLEIEPDRVAMPDGRPLSAGLLTDHQKDETFNTLMGAGLRARLEVQSILTGLLYVDLDFRPSQAARLTGLNYQGLREIPSIPPTVDEVMNTLEDLMRRLHAMPLEAMVDDAAATLAELKALLAVLEREMPGVLTNLNQTMNLVGQTSREFSATARETRSAMQTLQGQSSPVLKEAERTLQKATQALESTRNAASNIADTTAPDSTLQDAGVELRRAAQSLRQLTDYLERHPDSVLFGKPE